MRFILSIDLDNAAFEIDAKAQEQGVRCGAEVSRILRSSAIRRRLSVEESGPLFDINGNRVGGWHVDAGE